jgi:hypothetical protein
MKISRDLPYLLTPDLAMMTALNQLGYRNYHMMATGDPQNIKERHAVCWREALNYKVNGVGAAYGPKDFDKLLQHYSVSAFCLLLPKYAMNTMYPLY